MQDTTSNNAHHQSNGPRNLLVIYTSLSGQNGNSSKLVNNYIERLQANFDNGVNIVTRDIANNALPHLSSAEMGAWATPEEDRNAEQKQLAKLSDDCVAEVQAADEIIIAVPMYNFGIPSTLKAWIDRIARAGITFRYTENGPVGLIEGKQVTLLAARGGIYKGTELDSQTPYLESVLGFVGLTDVRWVYAEGLNMGEESAANAISSAHEKIIELSA